MRRLRVALETASGKGDTYSRRMWWLQSQELPSPDLLASLPS
jgi:hypothetical protein